jgi:hypothetical protein
MRKSADRAKKNLFHLCYLYVTRRSGILQSSKQRLLKEMDMDYRSDAEIQAEIRAEQMGEPRGERRNEEQAWSMSLWFAGMIIVMVTLGVCWYAFKHTNMNNSPAMPITVVTPNQQVLPVPAQAPGTTGPTGTTAATRVTGMIGNTGVTGTQGLSGMTGKTGASSVTSAPAPSKQSEQ